MTLGECFEVVGTFPVSYERPAFKSVNTRRLNNSYSSQPDSIKGDLFKRDYLVSQQVHGFSRNAKSVFKTRERLRSCKPQIAAGC